MLKEVRMHELRQTLLIVKCDAAKVFSVDRCAYVVRNHGAAPTCTHDRDQDISWPYGVTFELLVLLRSDESRFTFLKLIGNCVVYPEYANPFIYKFAVQQLTSEWTRSNRTALATGNSFNRYHRPTRFNGVAEHVEEGGLEEGVEVGEGLAALGPKGVRCIQDPRNPPLRG